MVSKLASVFVGSFLLLVVGASASGAQERGELEAGDTSAFDFLVGEWRGESPGSSFEAHEVLGGAVLEERWTEEAFSAIGLRSYDGDRWYLSFVTAGGTPQIWEGRREDGRWRFYREWELDGKAISSRTFWVPLSADRFVRVVEQSRDGGKTWTEHVRAVYERVE